jgi:hypothetical protein
MSNIEHYFENLLFHGEDNVNKYYLSEEERKAVEICVNYVIYSLFDNREMFRSFIKNKLRYLVE